MARTLQQEIGKRRAFESREEEAYLNVVRTGSVLAGPIAGLLKSRGLSESTYNVLRILRGSATGGRTCSEIGRDMVVRVPDVTRLIDRLAAQGYVQREADADDRRVVRVTITDDALALLKALDGLLRDVLKKQLGHMSTDELTQLSKLLVKARAGPAADAREA